MKLNKDPFLANMNMVELDGKKVLVRPSQSESTKSKEIVIGEERPPRMIKPKSPKDDNGRRMRGGGAVLTLKGHLRHPHGQVQRRQCRHQGSRKLDHPKYQTRQSGFPELGQHFYNRELVRQMILDSAVSKFKRSGTASIRLSSDTLLPGQTTIAWAVGASADYVSTLSSLGGVVWTMNTTIDALPPGMVRT
jgi:hypothetical protein